MRECRTVGECNEKDADGQAEFLATNGCLQHEVFAVAQSLYVFREVVGFRLRRQDQRFISLGSTVQGSEESINELKGQLKEMEERRFDGMVQEIRDCVPHSQQ